MQYKAICLTICSLWLTSCPAFALEMCGEPKQGGFVKFSDANLQKIQVNGHTYMADKNGKLAVAFGRDDSLYQTLKVFYKDGSLQSKNLQLNATKWDIQRIDGVPGSKVNPSKMDEKAILKERKSVSDAVAVATNADYWNMNMIKPVEGRTSGYFGGQRIMNGVKKNPHRGWDIAAKEGTEVVAPANGVVTLSGGPFFYSGNMVILEHGYNLTTIYAHLQKVMVKKGDEVKQGQVIGLVGKTGRVTGPHLHWGASLNGIRFDAQNLLNFDNDNCINL